MEDYKKVLVIEMKDYCKQKWAKTLKEEYFRRDIRLGEDTDCTINSTLLHAATYNHKAQTYVDFSPKSSDGKRAIAKLIQYYKRYEEEVKACLCYLTGQRFTIRANKIGRLLQVAEAHSFTHLITHIKQYQSSHSADLENEQVAFCGGKEYAAQLFKTLSFLQQGKLLTDFILHFGAHGSIHCHKIILDAICPAFLYFHGVYEEEFLLIDGEPSSFYEAAVVVMDLVYGRKVNIRRDLWEEVLRFAYYLKMYDITEFVNFHCSENCSSCVS